MHCIPKQKRNGLIDTYDFENLANVYPEIEVDGIIVQAYARRSPLEGIGSIKLKTRLAGVDDTSGVKRVYQEKEAQYAEETFLDWFVVSGWFPTDPSAVAWTESNFNSAEFGIESAGII